MLKDRLLLVSYWLIVAGLADVILRRFIQLEFMFWLNDLLWCASATLLILAYDRWKWLCFIPVVVGVSDELLQYYDKYPDLFDQLYSSTADIKDFLAYIVGFILSIILYKKMEADYHERKIATNDHQPEL